MLVLVMLNVSLTVPPAAPVLGVLGSTAAVNAGLLSGTLTLAVAVRDCAPDVKVAVIVLLTLLPGTLTGTVYV